ncbi:MAG: pilus assembly protein TadG-related protein [Candidatus Aquicultor sp.]
MKDEIEGKGIKPMKAIERLREERGVVMIVIAAALTALVLSVAVVVDIGLLYQERRQLQTSTDSAALAAAMDLAEGKSVSEATSRAIEYVSSNANVSPSQITVDFPESARVRVAASTQRTIFFASIVNKSTARVKAQSTAALGAANGVANLAPFIVPLQKVADYTGEASAGTFDIGEDRPLDPFSIIQSASGDIITYTITYNNKGNKPENITVCDGIPSGTVYDGGSVTNGGSYDPSSKQITWSFSGIQPGDYRLMRFSVMATSGSVGSITNTAYLTTDNGKTQSASTGGSAQRGYFWLCDFNDGNSGVPQFDAWIRDGYPEYVYAGDVANGTGMKDSLKAALEWRKGTKPKIIVPVYSYTEGGGSPGKYHVVGFAEFVMTGMDFSGNPKTVSGYFTDGTVVKGVPGPSPEAYYGIDTIWLVE